MATSNHVSAESVGPGCLHEPGDEFFYSQGGTLLGGRCRACLTIYGLGRCSGCQTEKRLWVVSESSDERYCGEICRRVHIHEKGQSLAPPARKPRGRK